MPSELRRCTRSARRAAGAAELARNHGKAAPEDHANVISLGRVEVDPGHARPADAPSGSPPGGRPPPTAAVIDSQLVTEMISRARRGYDAGKKIHGTKWHIAVDTTGLPLRVVIAAASVQDRDAAKPLLWNLRCAFPQITLGWADGRLCLQAGQLSQVNAPPDPRDRKRLDDLHAFTVLRAAG